MEKRNLFGGVFFDRWIIYYRRNEAFLHYFHIISIREYANITHYSGQSLKSSGGTDIWLKE